MSSSGWGPACCCSSGRTGRGKPAPSPRMGLTARSMSASWFSPADYEAWKRHIQDHEIVIQREVAWPRGRSFFFRDPDGNLLELAKRRHLAR